MAKIISAYPDACLINQLRKFLRNWFCSSGRSETQVTAECRFPQLAKTEEVIWTKHFSHWKTLHPDEQNLFFGNINTYILQSGLKHSLSTPIFHFISRYFQKRQHFSFHDWIPVFFRFLGNLDFRKSAISLSSSFSL